MLKVPTEFPHAGSEALYRPLYRADTHTVRIVSVTDGMAFITGKGVSCTVPLDHLKPAHAPRAPVDLWANLRVASVAHPSWTRAADAWADFTRWYMRVYQADPGINAATFKTLLKARGFVCCRATGGRDLGWAFALVEGERAAA